MLRKIAVTIGAVVTIAGLVLASAPAQAALPDSLRKLRGEERLAVLRSIGTASKSVCVVVAAARSNSGWVLVYSSPKCGVGSGHVSVYKRMRNGDWRYMFYDMDTSRCGQVPDSVRRDFYPYVC